MSGSRARRYVTRAARVVRRASARVTMKHDDIRYAPPDVFTRSAFQIVLGRDDPKESAAWAREVEAGRVTPDYVVDRLFASTEFMNMERPREHNVALHRSRLAWLRGLPPARRILDLGGSSQSDPRGAMVEMGWRYPFDELVIVDLPGNERHALFAGGPRPDRVETPLGAVTYRYHSMADLRDYEDGSFDMVFSGQSIEHVSEDDGDELIAGAYRVLAPGGYFCLDTPNGPVCRLEVGDAMIHPDHKIEYSHGQLTKKLEGAGFDVVEAKGLNLVANSVRAGVFSQDELLDNVGVFAVPEDCYLLAYVCRKPRS